MDIIKLLPSGWTVFPDLAGLKETFIISNPDNNTAVTINFDKRRWNLGCGYSPLRMGAGMNSEGKTYQGGQWKKSLVLDAVAGLRAAELGVKE